MRRHALILAATLAAACGDAGPTRVPFTPLDSDGVNLRDAEGRAVILRGVNARVAGVFDVTFDDGRTAVEPIPALEAADCARMRELGFNVLRLPINWSGVEPERDQFDTAYLNAVDAAVTCAADAGLFVLIDLHQDAWSKEIGEDGAPLWAIVPAPAMLLEGPLTDLEARRTSEQVVAAFESFFAVGDPTGLQGELIGALAHVAARWADHPAVIGFELFNEPVFGEPGALDAFHVAAATRVREVAPRKLVFFEPDAVRNFLDSAPLADAPFPVAGAVYAPHMYTAAENLRTSIDNARAEATSWGTPLFIGEWGTGPGAGATERLVLEQGLHDEYAVSSAYWLWKEESQGFWGLYERTAGGWAERPEMIAGLGRPRAERVAGTPSSIVVDDAAGTITVTYAAAVAAPHVFHLPPGLAATGATCSGAAATPVVQGTRVEVSCPASATTVTLRFE